MADPAYSYQDVLDAFAIAKGKDYDKFGAMDVPAFSRYMNQNLGTDRYRIGESGIRRGDLGVVVNPVARNAGAEPQSARCSEVALHQLRNAFDVDHDIGLAQSFAELHQNIGAASQNLSPTIMLSQQRSRSRQRIGRVISKVLQGRVSAKGE